MAATWEWTPLTANLLLGTVALLVAVIGTWGARRDARQARKAQAAAEGRERAALEEREIERRREQPSKVAVWLIVSTTQDDQRETVYQHHAANRSDLPIHRLSASYVEEDLRVVEIGTLGPGQEWEGPPSYLATPSPTYDWRRVVGWNFTDATGREWNGGMGPLLDVTKAIDGDVPRGYSSPQA